MIICGILILVLLWWRGEGDRRVGCEDWEFVFDFGGSWCWEGEVVCLGLGSGFGFLVGFWHDEFDSAEAA